VPRDIPKVILHEQAVKHFDKFILPVVQVYYESDGRPDWPARCEAWSNWVDGLCKSREISDWQQHNWTPPATCGD